MGIFVLLLEQSIHIVYLFHIFYFLQLHMTGLNFIIIKRDESMFSIFI